MSFPASGLQNDPIRWGGTNLAVVGTYWVIFPGTPLAGPTAEAVRASIYNYIACGFLV